MSIKMFYATIGGDYDSTRKRLVSDERIEKFLGMFFEDDTYSELLVALDAQDMESAFRCAHTLKGIAREIGLDRVADAASVLTESLRPQEDGNPVNPAQVAAQMQDLENAYGECLGARAFLVS